MKGVEACETAAVRKSQTRKRLGCRATRRQHAARERHRVMCPCLHNAAGALDVRRQALAARESGVQMVVRVILNHHVAPRPVLGQRSATEKDAEATIRIERPMSEDLATRLSDGLDVCQAVLQNERTSDSLCRWRVGLAPIQQADDDRPRRGDLPDVSGEHASAAVPAATTRPYGPKVAWPQVRGRLGLERIAGMLGPSQTIRLPRPPTWRRPSPPRGESRGRRGCSQACESAATRSHSPKRMAAFASARPRST
jgi:hypothetical protein